MQALAQTDTYLRELPNPKGVREAVSDTAGAAQSIAENNWRCVIASPRAQSLLFLCRLAIGMNIA